MSYTNLFAGDSTGIGGSNTNTVVAVGATGSRGVSIASGTLDTTLNFGNEVDTVTLTGSASTAFTVRQDGTKVVITDSAGHAYTMSLTSVADTLTFSDGSLSIGLVGSNVVLTNTTTGATQSLTNGGIAADITVTPGGGGTGSDTKWLLMEYMSADNNLEEVGLDNVNAMESANISSDITLTCILDRSSSYTTADGNWTNTREGIINHDDDMSHISSLTNSMTEQDMGNANTLTSFIDWSAATTSADDTCLILWDHGGGTIGCCFDDNPSGNNLSTQDIEVAIKNSSLGHVSLVAFDACEMGILDQAYALKGYSDVMVASEDDIPWDGYSYTALLNDFSSSTAKTTEDLASVIVDSYDTYYTYDVTLSALDLSKIDNLVSSMSFFSDTCKNASLDSSVLHIAAASSTRYGDNNIDLVDFMENIKDLSTSTSVDMAAQAVIDATNTAVLVYGGGEAASYGISIYMPYEIDSNYLTANTLVSATGWSNIYSAVWS